MQERIPDYNGGWPVWAWTRWDVKRPKPDLRYRHLPRGTPGVLIEAKVPAQLHLPHDFELWHHVLNDWHLARTEAESEAWDERERTIPFTQRIQEKSESWKYIFDLSGKERDWRWLGSLRKHPIATVIEEVRQEWIVSMQCFTAR